MTDRQAFWVSGLATLVVTGLLGTALWARTAPSPLPSTEAGIVESLEQGDNSWVAGPPTDKRWEGDDDEDDDGDHGDHDDHEEEGEHDAHEDR